MLAIKSMHFKNKVVYKIQPNNIMTYVYFQKSLQCHEIKISLYLFIP